ncbi:MAG: type II secretion system F family protein [Rhodospirillales bacterium]|nr:type II secretion system F family protein [Rhodospirillales bacterium]
MIEQSTIIFVIVGSVVAMLMIGGGIIGVTYIVRPKMLLRKRMNQIGIIGDGGASDKAEGRRQRRIQEKVKQLESQGDKKGFIDGIQASLLQADLDIGPGTYLIFSLAIGVVAALVALVSSAPLWAAIPAFIFGGFLLPKYVIGSIAKSRKKKFTKHFADALDLIVRGIRSGLPINECFSVVAREFDAPLGEEFRLLVEGQNLGLTLDDLMKKGIERLPTAEYKFFAIVTQIQRQTGGNLADTLSNLSEVLRQRKRMREKAQAMAAEAKASSGIIGSLPFGVSALLSVVNPDYLMLLFTTDTGNYMVMGGLFWMFLGTMVMKNMIDFEM